MKIFLATDHAGFELKEYIKKTLIDIGYDVEDCGAFEFDKTDDYPLLIANAARKVSQTPDSFGIVFGKSGTGEAIAANKIKGIRADLAINSQNVRLAREHNDANVLSLGAEFVNHESAIELVKLFLETKFSGEERHIRRIEQIKQLEAEA